MTVAAALRDVFCDAPACVLTAKGTPIARIAGTELQAFCGSCRRWTWWHAASA